MKSKDLLKSQLDHSMEMTVALINDLQDQPFAFPTAKGGNHALWITGHIAHTIAWLVHGFLVKGENPLEHWTELFGTSTQPTSDPDQYPPFEEVLAQCKAYHKICLERLDELSEDDLDAKVECPEEFESFIGTKRLCFQTAANHWLMHYGQLADIRRSLGRKPLMA